MKKLGPLSYHFWPDCESYRLNVITYFYTLNYIFESSILISAVYIHKKRFLLAKNVCFDALSIGEKHGGSNRDKAR